MHEPIEQVMSKIYRFLNKETTNPPYNGNWLCGYCKDFFKTAYDTNPVLCQKVMAAMKEKYPDPIPQPPNTATCVVCSEPVTKGLTFRDGRMVHDSCITRGT